MRNNIIIKYGLICGGILILTYILTMTPIINIYFDNSITGAVKYVTFTGCSIYGMNTWLRNNYKTKKYNYFVGLSISFQIMIIGSVIYTIFIWIFNSIKLNSIIDPLRIVDLFFRNLLTILICALIAPIFHSKNNKSKNIDENENILDEEI